MAPSFKKTIITILACAGAFLLVSALWYILKLIPIGAAYKAKVLCSGVFVSHRDPAELLRQELDGPTGIMSGRIDFKTKSVTASFPGIPDQRALYREGLGCTLVAGASEEELGKQGLNKGSLRTKEELPRGAPPEAVNLIVGRAFEGQGNTTGITRAIVILHKGRLIAERYGPGISADTPLPGWSMAKSVMNALVGVLVRQGKLSVEQPVLIREWSAEGDKRSAITLDHLLRMTSGLAFDERSGPFVSDVNRMLLLSRDAGAYALSKPLRYEPGSQWRYSSGSTNIISLIVRRTLGANDAEYHAFPRRELFDKIGMSGAVMETDASGTFVASSFLYATARDWARFGLLYAQDGVWEGERILPQGWVAYSARPTGASPRGRYGAHFWTNGAGSDDKKRPYPGLPADMFYASGYEGQYIVIVPSRDLVVVRLGFNKPWRGWDMESFVAEVIEALPEQPRSSI